jgi:hypothetical protein
MLGFIGSAQGDIVIANQRRSNPEKLTFRHFRENGNPEKLLS